MKAIPAYLMKAIPAYLMKAILSVPDEGYSERTWWRLFQKHVVRTIFDIYVFIIVVNNWMFYLFS